MKLPALFFLKSQTEERILRVNKSEITGENAINGDLLEVEGNHESSKDENTWFLVFLKRFYPRLNP